MVSNLKSAFCDTSIFVAAAISKHEHHSRAYELLCGLQTHAEKRYLSAHSLAEIYAVLTRIPVVPRITTHDAHLIIEANVLSGFTPVALSAEEYASLVLSFSERGITGGAVYDAIVLEAARKTNAEAIYSFNVPDFRRIAPELETKLHSP